MKAKPLGALLALIAGIWVWGSALASAPIRAAEVEALIHTFYGQIAAYDYAGITVRLVGDQWLIHRMFTMPKPKDGPAADDVASAASQPAN